jgi:hypothetical protein
MMFLCSVAMPELEAERNPDPAFACGAFLILLLLTSCTTAANSSVVNPGHKRAADIRMNPDAGRTQPIYVTLQLEDGTKLPFVMDTGSPLTILDESLKPKLGKCLGTEPFIGFEGTNDVDFFTSPKLYLGGVQLQLGTYVATHDWTRLSSLFGRPVMGVLGIDVLEHYCIQLDFAARRIRFLDGEHASKKNWGQPFPLLTLPDGRYSINDNLVGGETSGSASDSLIDTGFLGDGWLTPPLFQKWTNSAVGPTSGQAPAPDDWLGGEGHSVVGWGWLNGQSSSAAGLGRLGGESYPALILANGAPEDSGLGIKFLSRHLVTLDFPNRTLYLKHTNDGPDVEAAKAEGKSAATVLRQLKKRGRLPGWSKADESPTNGVSFYYTPTLSGRFDVRKKGDSSIYHFQVSREAANRPWRLQNAWRTDEDGRTTAEYPVDQAQ